MQQAFHPSNFGDVASKPVQQNPWARAWFVQLQHLLQLRTRIGPTGEIGKMP